ncbi:MAG: hypothetical protein WA782_20860 [Sulfitobacter sp.]
MTIRDPIPNGALRIDKSRTFVWLAALAVFALFFANPAKCRLGEGLSAEHKSAIPGEDWHGNVRRSQRR